MVPSISDLKKNNLLIEAENLAQAVQYKNKKTLILLRDYSFDEGAIKLIADKKNACFIIDFDRIINSRGVPRAILISKLRLFLEFCIKYGAFYTFATFMEKESDKRSPQDLEHISLLLGINRGQAKFALKLMESYAIS